MTPASMAVSKSMTGHHIVIEQAIERSLSMRIVVLLVLECVVVVHVLLHLCRWVDGTHIVLEFCIAELDWWYRVEVEVVAKHYL